MPSAAHIAGQLDIIKADQMNLLANHQRRSFGYLVVKSDRHFII